MMAEKHHHYQRQERDFVGLNRLSSLPLEMHLTQTNVRRLLQSNCR